jgi:hypothetical protein
VRVWPTSRARERGSAMTMNTTYRRSGELRRGTIHPGTLFAWSNMLGIGGSVARLVNSISTSGIGKRVRFWRQSRGSPNERVGLQVTGELRMQLETRSKRY